MADDDNDDGTLFTGGYIPLYYYAGRVCGKFSRAAQKGCFDSVGFFFTAATHRSRGLTSPHSLTSPARTRCAYLHRTGCVTRHRRPGGEKKRRNRRCTTISRVYSAFFGEFRRGGRSQNGQTSYLSNANQCKQNVTLRTDEIRVQIVWSVGSRNFVMRAHTWGGAVGSRIKNLNKYFTRRVGQCTKTGC